MSPPSSPSLLTLPPEILLQILTYLRSHPEELTSSCLAPYSTIHPLLTPLVESLTFEFVYIDAQKDHDVSKYFPRHAIHRRRAVKMIEYTVPVPISRLVDDDASLDDDIEGPHELFTRSIENLFRELTRWEEEAEPGRLQNRIALDLRMKRETAAPQEDAKNTKQPQLRLTRHTLPRLSYIVDKFGLLPGIWVGGSRWHVHVAPASVMYLARMLGSGLRELMFHTVVMGFSADDICARSDFAQAIEETTPYLTGLTKLIITHPYVEPRNHAWIPPSLMPSRHVATDSTSPSLDCFSLALHNLSITCRHLTTLSLTEKIVLGPEFFWPRLRQVQGTDVDGTSISPAWPHLESFSVALNIVAPSGEWYFSLPPGTQAPSTPSDSDSDSDSDSESESVPGPHSPVREFLTNLNPRTFTPLLCALTTATSRENMPRLRRFQALLNQDSRTSYVEILGLGEGVPGGMDNHRVEDGEERKRWYVYLGRDAGRGLVDGEWERDRAGERSWWREVRGRWEEWVGTGMVRVVRVG